jgi:lipoate---protein ligase
MRRLDLSLPTPEENLALDEALLEEAEVAGAGPEAGETLRLWEAPDPVVVVGRSSRLAKEVDREACRKLGIPVLRRVSGGAAVVAGPGCLMYALVLGLRHRSVLRAVDAAHRFVLGTVARALSPLVPAGVSCQGISDLVAGGRKCSGNSMRIRRDHLLYHGTLLYDFDLELVGRCLPMPPRQPAYRAGRLHEEFLTNLPAEPVAIRAALALAFDAKEPRADWPQDRVAELVRTRYGRREWNTGRLALPSSPACRRR